MPIFEKNKCRLCYKIFCCECCRKKHEKVKHSVFPDCDICIYGGIRISDVSAKLFKHLQTSHWPLHCVWCKKVFNTEDELGEHFECPIITNYYSEKIPLTPSIQIEEDTFESPPLAQLFQKNQQGEKNLSAIASLATSTPMQCCKEDNNILLLKVKTVIITPVNSTENTKESILKKAGRADSFKRRVTFCNTILTDNMSSHGSDENQNYQSSMLETPMAGGTTGTFYSAKDEPSHFTRDENKALSNTPKLPSTKKVSVFKLETEKPEGEKQSEDKEMEENNTLWISAMTISKTGEKFETGSPRTSEKSEADNPKTVEKSEGSPKTDEKSEAVSPKTGEKSFEDSLKTEAYPEVYATPLEYNPKKKKINVVMPTPILKEELNFEFGRPIQISSTPNNSMIPVKSVPTAKEIFLRSRDRPSTSKSELNEYSDIRVEEPHPLKENKYSNKPFTAESCSEIKENNTSGSENSLQNKLWLSVNKFVKNVTNAFQSFAAKEGDDDTSSTSNQSNKRLLTEYDTEDEPKLKRYKFTDIKCRRTIRELPPIHSMRSNSREIHINIVNNVMNNVVNNIISVNPSTQKTFVDKATQTDDWTPS